MCGRNSLFIPQSELEDRFDAEVVTDGGYEPRFNIAPGEGLEVITNEASAEIDQFQWGLAPEWLDDPSDGWINARSETADEKPAFRAAWDRRPCLVLSSGFYEWKEQERGGNIPYRVYRESDPAFAMAGLWEEREDNGESLRTVTILTTDSNELVDQIHNRMPVILRQSEEEDWLTGGPEERKELCRPYPDADLDTYQISRRVNNPTNDEATIIEPESESQSDLSQFS